MKIYIIILKKNLKHLYQLQKVKLKKKLEKVQFL